MQEAKPAPFIEGVGVQFKGGLSLLPAGGECVAAPLATSGAGAENKPSEHLQLPVLCPRKAGWLGSGPLARKSRARP